MYGLGDATLNGREKAVVSFLEDHCIPALIGKDARNIEDIWHYFYRGVYWKRGAVNMTALSAIDLALWDIKGKALGTPLYNLLGGKSRERALVYAHATGKDLPQALDSVAEKLAAGFQAVRVQAGVPGVPESYGVPKGDAPYEPAGKGLPREEVWDTAKYLRFAPRLFERVRERFGNDVALLHDVHHRCTPIEAARLAKELEPYRLFWLEDPVSGELQEGLRLMRQHSTTPIAIGEVFNSVYDYTTLISEQLIDFVRMPPCHGGGITHLQKVAAFASIYHVHTGFHGATDLSPVNLAASLHFDLAINNFGIQEYMPHPEIVNDVFHVNYQYEQGTLSIDDSPGIGVDIDEAKAKKYPYSMACLPVARKTDGTLTYW
ncbi:MAG: D-galactonate dehydratase family protein [Polyangiaceae bacterium]